MTKVFISCSLEEKEFASVISRSLQNRGIQASLFSDAPFVADWHSELLSAIKQSDAFIAIVDRPNPNIMYELGVAIGSSKDVLLVRTNMSPIPIDISAIRTINAYVFDGRCLEEIVEWIDSLKTKRRAKSVNHTPVSHELLRELAADPALVDEISSRQFEESITRFFTEIGIDAQSTSYEPDRSYDIGIRNFAKRNLIVVEVKKLNRNSRVSVQHVQQVLGVTLAAGADCGMIITGGQFTSSSTFFAKSSPLKIVLLTLEDLVKMSREDLERVCQ